MSSFRPNPTITTKPPSAAAMNGVTDLTPAELAVALQEAKARGLPDGWDVKLDKRKRRKWIAPNGRTCDSIPKALTMSIELGLLPPDTVVIHPLSGKKRKRPAKKQPGNPKAKRPTPAAAPPKVEVEQNKNLSDAARQAFEAAAAASAAAMARQNEEDEEYEEEEEEDAMEPPTDPYTNLDHGKSHLTTVHWDPYSPAGSKVGWRIRVADGDDDWKEGRILRYDPCSHKHLIRYAGKPRSSDRCDTHKEAWLHLRIEDGVQIATRIVWAHVKGYAWWPAMVMESDSSPSKEGYVNVEFFGSLEVATLRDGPECIRPFENGKVDGVISKNKKKRNSPAIAMAIQEEKTIQMIRNDAALYYAEKAFGMAARRGHPQNLVGKRVQIFRSDINYPYGDTLIGKVRQYSTFQKKWLLSFEVSTKTKKKYESSWINLLSKEVKMRVMDKKSSSIVEPSDTDLLPFLRGFKFSTEKDDEAKESQKSERFCSIARSMVRRCNACTDSFKPPEEAKLQCNVCESKFHIGCADPPEPRQRLLKLNAQGLWTCSKCTPCRGCYQRDVTFGSHTVSNVPPMLSQFAESHNEEPLDLCSMCVEAYDNGQFCPNCAHSWDDDHFQRVQRQIRWQQANKPKKRGRKRRGDDGMPIDDSDVGAFTAPAVLPIPEPFPLGAKVDPAWYFAETSQWGYTEVDMLTCDDCKLWVHAGCAGVDEDEYDQTSSGEHPIYSKEFLCRMCCRKRCRTIIEQLQSHDAMHLFAIPVTEKVAPTYRDFIESPMDLQTLSHRAELDEYRNYAWVREMFELMVFNALTFNRHHQKYFSEAKRFYTVGISKVFNVIGRAAPPSRHEPEIKTILENDAAAKKLEEDRVKEDESTEKKDLVAGAKVAAVTLPDLREAPPGPPSCLPVTTVKLTSVDAYYCGWMDCCFTCGSSGASDTMLFCVDCGEAFHSFCVNAPVHSMEPSSVAGWRCHNCKLCEISGDNSQDERRMLFCEMCDRAFAIDLLDPPLAAVPPGLWICGQCVDCHKCHNVTESSIKYWSRDPQLCYRCGGCDGLASIEQYKKGRTCPVCAMVWRDSDVDLVQCVYCKCKVHAGCDVPAKDLHRKLMTLSDGDEIGRDELLVITKYSCPPCRKKQGVAKDFGKVTRGHMFEFASKAIGMGVLEPCDNYGKDELCDKLMEQIDWKTRNLWRDEYRKVVLEGVRFLEMATEQYGEPRILMDRFWQDNLELPAWMGQRATRFMHIAKMKKLNTLGFSARKIENCVFISKLAASWLKVACRTMGMNTKKHVKGYDRVMKLLVAPDSTGTVLMPFDNIRYERNRIIISKDEWLEKIQPTLATERNTQLIESKGGTSSVVALNTKKKAQPLPKLPVPLCGWNDHINEEDTDNVWEDPRECCLCHTCGDDDAGVLGTTPDRTIENGNLRIPRVGRLLPMGEGLWVHASCALWSSETWEAPTGGLVNAMEKARSRGAQLKCFGCGHAGATVGCIKANCSNNYHFQCAYACGAVFTSKKQLYCAAHKDCTTDIIPHPSLEHMKTLIVAPCKASATSALSDKNGDNQDPNAEEDTICMRLGALVVHSLGTIDTESDHFHTKENIMPPGYMATRIFWSTIKPLTRTVYILKIDKSPTGKAVFSITPGDDPTAIIESFSDVSAYNALVEKVNKANYSSFSHGDSFSKLPTARKAKKDSFGLTSPQFFGFGLNQVRKALESLNGVEAVVAPLTDNSPTYNFCYILPTVDAVMGLQRKRAAAAAEKALENLSGCARTEGMKAVARSGGSGRITRALVRNAEADLGATEASGKKVDTEKAKADRNRHQKMYRDMKAVPMEQRLVAKRSHIHGWGLFSKSDVQKDGMIVEYMGETVRQCVADKREKQYEISGEGSCYMFRLDRQRIVDATSIGCMARFMNHCCQPNAYAKVISVDTDQGQEKKIIVFACRDVSAGEEITYDYKFPVEDGSLRCTCGAPNCIGRMN